MASSEFTIEISRRIIDGWVDEGIEYAIVEFLINDQVLGWVLFSIPAGDE